MLIRCIFLEYNRMEKIKVVFIDDNPLLCEGVISSMNNYPDIEIHSICKDMEIVQEIKKVNPHVLLLDESFVNINSMKLISYIRSKVSSGIKIIIMDLFPTQSNIVNYVKTGVSAFIMKNASIDDFYKTIRKVHQGGKVLPHSMTKSLFAEIVGYAIKNGKTSIDKSVRITSREQEIIGLIKKGMTNKEIAEKLHIAAYTVKSHVHNILEKLALRSRLEIALYSKQDD